LFLFAESKSLAKQDSAEMQINTVAQFGCHTKSHKKQRVGQRGKKIVFQKELYNFESLYTFIQRICMVY
jgi:hypothetical protein